MFRRHNRHDVRGAGFSVHMRARRDQKTGITDAIVVQVDCKCPDNECSEHLFIQ